MPKWIYLSPHLDDVAISCGGLVWGQIRSGLAVEIWTLCAGDPPPGPLSPFAQELHGRWQTGLEATSIRRQEDQHACQELGAACYHFQFPDCIYRMDEDGRHLYASEQAIFGSLEPADLALVETASRAIAARLSTRDFLISPLAIGNHIDHQLTRAAAEATGHSLWYYADYPYACQRQEEIQKLVLADWQAKIFELSDEALQPWARAVAAHQSQISSFWSGMDELLMDLKIYREQMGGGRLWQPPAQSGKLDRGPHNL